MSTAIWDLHNRVTSVVVLGLMAMCLLFSPLAAQAAPEPEWGQRAALVESNSEMAVAPLDGKIYIVGGYPSTRITVNTVQVYDIKSDSWSLTTP